MPDFFGKLKESMSKGVATVGVKSKEMIETTKIRTQINTLQDQVKNALIDLGNTVYTMSMNDRWDPAVIMPKCEAIRGLQEQIKEQEAQITQVHTQSEEAMQSIRPSPPTQSSPVSYQPPTPVAGVTPVSPPSPSMPYASSPVIEGSTTITLNYGSPITVGDPLPRAETDTQSQPDAQEKNPCGPKITP